MLTNEYKHGASDTELRVYDSIGELVEHGLDASNKHLDHAMSSLKDATFVGRSFRTLNGVRSAANGQWDDGLEILDSMSSEIADADIPAPVSRKRKVRFDESNGDEIDYDRLRSGQDFWRTCRRDNVRGPATVTVMVNVGGNCMVRARDLLWRGAAAVAMTDLLEEAGYRVELWAVQTGERVYTDGTGCTVAVCIKQTGEVVDRSTLINAVSGWFFRTVMFGELAHSHCKREPRGSLGRTIGVSPQDAQEITGSDNCFIVNASDFTRESAVKSVKKILNSLN